MKSIVEVCKTDNLLAVKDPSHWKADTTRQEEYKVHRNTNTIYLRFRRPLRGGDIVNYPLFDTYKEYINEYINLMSNYYEFVDWAAIIARLGPGKSIPKHKDNGPYFINGHRIHMPLVTHDDVLFTVGDTTMNMKPGIFYEIDNLDYHGVENKSPINRDHLIIDLLKIGKMKKVWSK